MLLFGHRFIPSMSFYHILDIDSITHTPPSSTIYLEFSEENLDIITHAKTNEISFALSIKSIEEFIYAAALNANYIIVERSYAKTFQEIAQTYLLDSKVLVHIENDKEIEDLALLGVDGVIYFNAIIKVNS